MHLIFAESSPDSLQQGGLNILKICIKFAKQDTTEYRLIKTQPISTVSYFNLGGPCSFVFKG